MTREKFIQVLDGEGYSYEIEGDKIIITEDWIVDLRTLISLPPEVEFNGGYVHLDSLTSLPSGVVFNNVGEVNLSDLTSISPGVEFKNEGYVWLNSLVGSAFSDWEGNIEGVDSNRLLNGMISKGIFER